MNFNNIQEIIKELKDGKMVIVVDDEDRENEGDLVMAAEFTSPEDINFMATYGRGLICVPMEEERLRVLNLYSMASPNSFDTSHSQDPYKTAWMISVDASLGITTGISAFDRARTIGILADSKSKPEDLVKPGHVFPLQARKGGVLVRAGHAEAAVDLMKVANLSSVGVICEIMNEDGTMARLPQLQEFAKTHNLRMCSIRDLIEYRHRREILVKRMSQSILPTELGDFTLIAYESVVDNMHHLALIMGLDRDSDISAESPVLVRVHSECLTGDVFGSLRCDCGLQLHKAMEMISKEKRGIILYMNQEGRGIGLIDKIRAYNLQDHGLDTVEANQALGFDADLRNYGIGAQILVDLGIKNIKLLTNNPRKIVGLEGYDLHICERIPLKIAPTENNRRYLETKKTKLGHYL